MKTCRTSPLSILLLSATFWLLKDDPIRSAPIGYVSVASSPNAVGAAILAMEDQLEVESAMIRIRPRSKHYTYQADLLHWIGSTKLSIAEQHGTASDLVREERRRSLAEAIASLDRALELGPPYGHAEDPEMSRKDIEGRLFEWRLALQRT